LTLARKLTANVGYAVAGRLASALFGLATTAIMARQLGPDLFGAFRTAFAWGVLCCTLANLGLVVVCLQEISRDGADKQRIVGTALGLRLLIGAFCIVLSAGVAWFVPVSKAIGPLQMAYATAIAALGGVATLGHEIVSTIFQQSLTQKRASIAELVGGTATLAFTLLAVATDGGLLAYTAAITGGLVVTAICAALLAEQITPVRPRLDLPLAKRMIVSGLPLFGSEAVGMITSRLDTVLLSVLSIATQVGYYGAAGKIREIAVRFPYMFAALLMPILTSRVSQPREFRRYLADALVVTWIFAVAAMIGLIRYADLIVAFLAGQKFAGAVPTVQLTGPAVAVTAMAAVLQYAAYSLDRSGAALKAKTVSSIVALIVMLVLIPAHGAVGTMAAVMVGELLFGLMLIAHASPDGQPVMPWRRLVIVSIVGLLVAGVAVMLKALDVPRYLRIMAVIAAYPALLLAFRVTSISQLRSLTARA